MTHSPQPAAPLFNWPIQVQLAPLTAPYFTEADLLIAASCTAFAHGNFGSFTEGKPLLIGCSKLEKADFTDRIAKILRLNRVHSVQLCRMEVPCCGGMVSAVRKAITQSGLDIPLEVTVISPKGKVNP